MEKTKKKTYEAPDVERVDLSLVYTNMGVEDDPSGPTTDVEVDNW